MSISMIFSASYSAFSKRFITLSLNLYFIPQAVSARQRCRCSKSGGRFNPWKNSLSRDLLCVSFQISLEDMREFPKYLLKHIEAADEPLTLGDNLKLA